MYFGWLYRYSILDVQLQMVGRQEKKWVALLELFLSMLILKFLKHNLDYFCLQKKKNKSSLNFFFQFIDALKQVCYILFLIQNVWWRFSIPGDCGGLEPILSSHRFSCLGSIFCVRYLFLCQIQLNSANYQ